MLLTLTSTVLDAFILILMLCPVVRAVTNSSTVYSSTPLNSSSVSRTISRSAITSTLSSTSQPPFFPYPTSTPTPQNTDSSPRAHLTKVVLQWLFLVTAVCVFIGISIWTCHRIRRMRRLRATLASGSGRRSTETPGTIMQISRAHRFPSADTASTAPIILANPFLYPSPYPQHILQPAHYNAPQVRAMDTDGGGRRLGANASNDIDGELDDKDILPAYDISGGPPKYVE